MVPGLVNYVGKVSRATQSRTLMVHNDSLPRRPKGHKSKPEKQALRGFTTTIHAAIGDCSDPTSVSDPKQFLVAELRAQIKTIQAKTTMVKLHACAPPASNAQAAQPQAVQAQAAAIPTALGHLRAMQ